MKKFLFLLFLFSSSVFSDASYRYGGGDIYYSYHEFSANNIYSKMAMPEHISYGSVKGLQRNPLYSAYHGWRVCNTGFEWSIGILKTLNHSEKKRCGTLQKKFASFQCIAYLPVLKGVELFVGGGLSIMNMSYDNLDITSGFDTQKLAKKITIGLQLPISDNMNARTSFIWHDLKSFKNHQFTMDKHIHAGFGLNYKFGS